VAAKVDESSSSSSSSSDVVSKPIAVRTTVSSSSSSSSDEAERRIARARARAQERAEDPIAAPVSPPRVSAANDVSILSSSSSSSSSSPSSSGSYSSSSGSYSSGSYDSDSDDDDDIGVAQSVNFRPVFVKSTAKKAAVAAAIDDEHADLDAHARHELALKELRREQARSALLEDLRQEEQAKLESRKLTRADDGLDADPSDAAEQAAEYAAWRVRELARVKRELAERQQAEGDAAEVERRRNMTDAEILAEDAALLAAQAESKKNKPKMAFLQKYYHEGAFFRGGDAPDILEGRDFTAPTEADRVDKSILPKAMQVRRGFGEAGHSRYTHLKDQDTTDKNALWFGDRKLTDDYKSKIAGVRSVSDDRADGAKKRRTEK
jgi:microfibrillar-associated protein 1